MSDALVSDDASGDASPPQVVLGQHPHGALQDSPHGGGGAQPAFEQSIGDVVSAPVSATVVPVSPGPLSTAGSAGFGSTPLQETVAATSAATMTKSRLLIAASVPRRVCKRREARARGDVEGHSAGLRVTLIESENGDFERAPAAHWERSVPGDSPRVQRWMA